MNIKDETTPEPDEEAAREFVLDEFSPLQPEAEGASNPTDTQEVVAFLVDCPAQPTLEFANVHVPDSAEPLVRQSALTACQQEVERLTQERDEALEAENEAKDCFWAIYPDWVEMKGHGISAEAARTKLSERIGELEELLHNALAAGLPDEVANPIRAALKGQSNEA